MKHKALALLGLFLTLSGSGYAQNQGKIGIASAVPLSSASNKTDTLKVPHGSFIPFYATTTKPTLFQPSDASNVSILELPASSAFGGNKYDVPGVKAWTFPDAKSDIFIVIANNTTDTAQIITITAIENPGEGKKPVITGTVVLEIGVDPNGKFSPIPKPKPDDKTNPDIDTSPVTYTGKWQICVLEETVEATAQRGRFFSDKDLRAFLKEKLVEAPRVIDKDGKTKDGSFPSDLVPYLNIWKSANTGLPYYFVVAAEDIGTTKKGTILQRATITPDTTPAQWMAKLKEIR